MFNNLLDEAFERAQENGDFEDLPGAGKPIARSALTTDPFAHVYSESDFMTPVGAIQRKIDDAQKRLAATTDPDQRKAIQAELSSLDTRKAVEMETFNRYT
jgi:DnaJ-like protein